MFVPLTELSPGKYEAHFTLRRSSKVMLDILNVILKCFSLVSFCSLEDLVSTGLRRGPVCQPGLVPASPFGLQEPPFLASCTVTVCQASPLSLPRDKPDYFFDQNFFSTSPLSVLFFCRFLLLHYYRCQKF